MKEFMNRIYKLIGPSEFGVGAFIYALYLKITKKLPYEIKMILKPESKGEKLNFEVYYFIFSQASV